MTVGIEGQEVTGTFMMNKLLLAKNFKLEVKIPLEKRYVIHEEQKATAKTTAKKGAISKDK